MGRCIWRNIFEVNCFIHNFSVFSALILSQINALSMVHLENLHTRHFLLIALIVAVVSIFGDFVESFMKRVADVKDSGNFFPGHGGVLDRVFT